MADPLKYDRSAAFEMLQKQHGEYASPEQINQELDSYEKANGLGAPVEQTAPVTGSAPPPLTAQDKSIAAQAENYALVPSTARETVNTITAPPVGSTSLPDVASAAWNNLSTAEKYAVGGGTAALGSLAVYGAKKLVDRFLISDKQAAPPIDRTRDIPMGDTKPPPPPPPPPEGPKLSAVDQQILDRQAINKPVRDAYLKQISASTPAAEVIVNPPPVNTPKKAWEPPTASLAIAQPVPVPTEDEFLKRMEEKYGPLPSKTPAVTPELSTTSAEPITGAAIPTTAAEPTTPAEPIATTKEIPAAPVATDAERVQALKDLEKPVAKETTEPAKSKKAPKPEYFEGFKKLPGTERQLLGTLGVANNTERAKSLVNALKSTLPEGAALEFPKTEAGVSKGGMPNPQDVMTFTNKHLGTAMKLDEAGKFPADFRYTEENLAKMHQSILDEYANAKTPSAKAAAEKGFATLRSLAGLAGFGALAYGSLEAYKHGKKTGDWTPAGELGLNTIAGAINPALMLGTHMTGLNAGEEQELAKRRYNAMVGAGRGIAPPSAYQR